MKRMRRLLRKFPLVVVAAILFILLIAVALLAPKLTGHDPNHLEVIKRLKPPSVANLLGTDDFGRDIWSRMLYGTRASIGIGLAVTIFTSALGILLGLLAGYYRRADHYIMRVMDGLMAFPAILLAIAIMASLGAHTVNVVVALAVVYTPRTVRVVRSSVLTVRDMEYTVAARALGASDLRIMFRHILPNVLSPLIIQATFNFANAVLTEAALSFLGAGVPPEVSSWGGMLAEGRQYIRQAWWMTVYPGIAIMITVLTLNLLGDGVRDMLDPRTARSSE
jgi:peptide/nickel transport system permease protein